MDNTFTVETRAVFTIARTHCHSFGGDFSQAWDHHHHDGPQELIFIT